MHIETDDNGTKFFRFKNVRVSVKHAEADKDWENGTGGNRYLQIQAYQNGQDFGRTHWGPQIPITDKMLSDEKILVLTWAGLNAAT